MVGSYLSIANFQGLTRRNLPCYDTRMDKKKGWAYKARIQPETLPRLQSLAEALGFVATAPGGKFGKPSPPAMLDMLGEAFERDPVGVTLALRVLGVTANPQPDDVRFSSEPPEDAPPSS